MANFRDLLKESVLKHGNNVAFTVKLAPEQYRDVTYVEFYEEIRSIGTALIDANIAGNRIAVVGANCYEWFLTHCAILLSGSVSVPLDKGLPTEELKQSLERADIKYIFYGKDQASKIDEILAEKPELTAFPIYERPAKDGQSYKNIKDLIGQGQKLYDGGMTDMDRVHISDNEMSIMLFTSGTTSQSKVVMLSQNNIVSNAYNVLQVEPVYENDTNIALLPYHHIFGSVAQWVILLVGARTVFCDGLKFIQKNMIEYGVTMFIGVPLIVESMYKRVMHQVEKQGIAGKVRFAAKLGRFLNKFHIDIRRKLFKQVLEAFGGKLRMCIIGGAAGDAECIKGFSDFGILTIQGYGLTETSPILAAEYPGFQKPGTVGKAIPGVEVKIDNPDENGIGEIIARGENIMLGYFNNQEATDEVIYDGWFHTGDLGFIDKQGFLTITGRKKNVIVLKNGKNVFPEELEQMIAPLPYVAEAVVLGIPKEDDERDLVVTLKLVYNEEVTQGKSEAEIYDMVKEDIEAINDKTPTYKRIRKIIVTNEEMVKTTTGKVKRFVEVEKILNERKQA